MRKLFGAAVAALLVIALAAPALASAPAKKASVGNFFIHPGKLTIKRGTKVTWHWTSGYHDVAVKSGPAKFDSGFRSGGSYSHTFTKAGTYHLFCRIHFGMTETVVVR